MKQMNENWNLHELGKDVQSKRWKKQQQQHKTLNSGKYAVHIVLKRYITTPRMNHTTLFLFLAPSTIEERIYSSYSWLALHAARQQQ